MASRAAGHNQEIGRWGESAAAEYLCTLGYELLGRNLRTPFGEIDLLVRSAGLIVFVEVKTRTSSTFGPPEQAVSPRKLQHMIQAAQYYAAVHDIDYWQIDVIAVEGRPGTKPLITHFENAV
jgi:putative endonuclease